MFVALKSKWNSFSKKHLIIAQFISFFIVSNGVTLLQMVIMPAFRHIFEQIALIDHSFQIWQIGSSPNGQPYFVFDYAAGTIAQGGGGGLAYFLAVEISMGIAQIINFFLQRKVTFRAKNNVMQAAFWYVLAYAVISVGAAALQGIYKTPIYNLFINIWHGGAAGETAADVVTMIINSAISFWVFFPIFKFIFKNDSKSKDSKAGSNV